MSGDPSEVFTTGKAAYDVGGVIHCGDCDKPALHERHGDEVQWMCSEHGWVATLHESAPADE